MSKKTLAIICGVVLLVILALGAIPVSAATASGNQVTPATQQLARCQLLKRMLSIQDKAKIDALIARGVASGKISAEQGVKIKDFWAAHHTHFARLKILQRIIGTQDEAKLDTALDRLVSAGKITQEQAAKIETLWEQIHGN